MDPLEMVFGQAFLTYVLAKDVLPPGQRGLSIGQKDVQRALTRLALQVQGEQPLVQRINLMNAILGYVEDKQTTLANSWRFECIGDTPPNKASDDLALSCVLELAYDMYPGFLLPASDDEQTLF